MSSMFSVMAEMASEPENATPRIGLPTTGEPATDATL